MPQGVSKGFMVVRRTPLHAADVPPPHPSLPLPAASLPASKAMRQARPQSGAAGFCLHPLLFLVGGLGWEGQKPEWPNGLVSHSAHVNLCFFIAFLRSD